MSDDAAGAQRVEDMPPRYGLLASPCHLCSANWEHHTCEREVTRLLARLRAVEVENAALRTRLNLMGVVILDDC